LSFSVFPDIVKDCPKVRNLPKIFLRSFENVGPELLRSGMFTEWFGVDVVVLLSPGRRTVLCRQSSAD